MKSQINHARRAAGVAAALLTAAMQPALAGFRTTFLDQPTGFFARESNGSAILADDFVPAYTGRARLAFWWGTQAPSDSRWVIAFYANTSDHPGGDNPVTDALFKVEVSDVISFQDFNYGGDPEMWRFGTGLPEVLELIAGNEYWFSVTNLAPGWKWAEANNAPTVGSENFDARVTDRTELPGPDCVPFGSPPLCYGPWANTASNLAFQIGVPEPSSAFLAGVALVLLGAARHGKPGHAVKIGVRASGPLA